MKKLKRLMVIAGGTGGHIFPGIVVANYLKQQGWDIVWLGTANRLEADLVPKYNIKIECIKLSCLRYSSIKKLLIFPFEIILAIKKAKVIMERYQPNIVLGMGSYISGPCGIAAWLCNIPIVLHEQNMIAGLTNRLLSKIAKCVLQAFPSAFPNAIVVGNPIRESILALPPPEARLVNRHGVINILVIGGSQGSRILNQILPEVAAKLIGKVTIWHQVGEGNYKMTETLYKKFYIKSNSYKITKFIDNMAEAYAWADILICRSGALTVSEISVVGIPAIFIPFQHKDQQQYWNAVPLEMVGAAKIIEQSKISTNVIVHLLNKWSRPLLLEMAKKARSISITDATKRIASILIKIAN
ncbi:UDP-N-acetylglucosamine--N-acetylmuramyl- (pentapeptide) pyrophosphoryl-undecaprenol N-acetylglucosamine transferase [Candidatus Arsenophonus lipoptenae]|uniref:UDP-N-acetylglucosamine--N-acetylmuramyl-(pentapeptide) pyrophosphoryl-undecaprenol N-acetylglucosamine transferase n=1 Tax=Candidatus Arsenophonus lipoptenae TaxID=634113 RepID=A0A0X9VTG5_9GAMM|nr:undecaprenyldiphospho-muramoylpentapeptide beta-N-acetylglucosaminyltransferase [Candidatus Arsenophonus lipoptenae]AMA65102.1 UDP-N-acetylglucosamine--N-acetylmuramyl- (pentapeptide) pyrophosphoryl-undecaprenol N-acetylglucosamine transferase [Candidatus Arsenophonus lipoptenae]